MKLVPPALVVLLSIILVAGYSQDNKSGQKTKDQVKPQVFTPEPTGDPPVTLSDGSLHADFEVEYRPGGPYWTDTKSGQDITIISPYPSKTGYLRRSECKLPDGSDMMGDGRATSAYFWADSNTKNHTESSWDIAPPVNGTTTITITYDKLGAKGKDPRIQITVPWKGEIKMETKAGSWVGAETDAQRDHQRRGHVEKIEITGSAISHGDGVWIPYNLKHNHFTIGFCFK